ncbi:MAG: hypothetical protein E7012_04110 [Alphaproteobacteria bacterium]|nr:hypothetical protein [Alphaproteobacteria bacterium]
MMIEQEFSNPDRIKLSTDVEKEVKIPQDTVDNRIDIINNADKASEYGRPRLDLTRDELVEEYKKKDIENIQIIEKSFVNGEINIETRDFLINYYQNSYELYEGLKTNLNELLGAEPKNVKYINLLEGKVDEDTPYFDEHVGPDTTMIYEYDIDAPWRVENKFPGSKGEKITIQIVMPMMKDVHRAIDKVKIGGKYDMERKKELEKLKYGKYLDDLDKRKLRKPIERMKDILRCSILAPRYDDVDSIFKNTFETGKVLKSSRSSKYLDNDAANAEEFYKNSQNYRDNKNYLMINIPKSGQFYVEIQYKTDVQFYNADILTHLEYEKARAKQELFYKADTEGDKAVLNNAIYIHKLNIQKINAQAYEQCNFNVLHDIKKLEDKHRAKGINPDKDGTYPLCRELAQKCLLVRSAVALTKDVFEKGTAWERDIKKRYKKIIEGKYLADIRGYKNKQGR